MGDPLRVETEPDPGSHGAGGAVNRRPELAVVGAEKQSEPKTPSDLVGGHLCNQRTSGLIRSERARDGHRRMTRVAHV